MLTLNTIKPNAGAVRVRKRVGRGPGSGNGQTAGYGLKGDKSRSGAHHKAYFEGGQTPLIRRTPKRGFRHENPNRCQIVNLGAIEPLITSEKEIGPQWLFDHKLVHSDSEPVKVLGNGEFTKAVTIKAHAFSNAAKERIEKAKGKAEEIANT